MIDPSIFTTETPLTNLERLELWRRKKWGWKLEDWWRLSHPKEDGLLEDTIIGDMVEVPLCCRRQAH